MANDANIFENANHRKSIFRSSSFVVFNVFFCFIASECPHVVFHSFFISNGDSDKQCLKMWHCIFALLLSVRLHAWTALWQPDIQNHDSNPTWRIKLKNVKDGNRKQTGGNKCNVCNTMLQPRAGTSRITSTICGCGTSTRHSCKRDMKGTSHHGKHGKTWKRSKTRLFWHLENCTKPHRIQDSAMRTDTNWIELIASQLREIMKETDSLSCETTCGTSTSVIRPSTWIFSTYAKWRHMTDGGKSFGWWHSDSALGLHQSFLVWDLTSDGQNMTNPLR